MAGWLYRNLKEIADEIVVCDPRRNAHIAKDGDKDDAIDAEKLNNLYRSGHLRVVHQSDSADHAAKKQLVGMYHSRVKRRTAEQSRLLALGKRWGLMLTSEMLMASDARENLRQRFESASVPVGLITSALELWDGYQQLVIQEESLYEKLCQMVKGHVLMRRIDADILGYGPVRAATLVTYWETPWRFKSKSALFKYNGIGLHRERSGDGYERLCVEQSCNRLLRNVAIGGAQCAIEHKENIFARRYAQWIRKGLSPPPPLKMPAGTLPVIKSRRCGGGWGMWKTDTTFDPNLIPELL